MGIKTVKYKANSIVYFKGDVANRVYILKKGSIVTKTTDLKTNEDILTMIKVGEFIGVKNVISNQPYSETVSTLTDTELVVFYKEDFEQFILTNSRIMMQTLVVFSNQLRKIHKEIKDLNDIVENVQKPDDNEKDLYELGVYFKKQHKIEYSNYCFKKYAEVYPTGKYLDAIKNNANSLTELKENEIKKKEEIDNSAVFFQEGENYFSEGNFAKASECFTTIIENNGYHVVDAIYLNGVSLFNLKKYKLCIKNYSQFLSKHKSHQKINDVMYYVGCSYKEIGDKEQAQKFLKQVVKVADSSPIARLAHEALKGI